MSLSQAERHQLATKALEAVTVAYSPYSKFRVGACLLTESGEYIPGCNVENASYGGTICAERTAMVKAVSTGHKRFKGLAVATDVQAAISPCGICRQFLREFCHLDMPILLILGPPPASRTTPQSNNDALDPLEGVEETTMGGLLPHSFGPEDLERPRGGS